MLIDLCFGLLCSGLFISCLVICYGVCECGAVFDEKTNENLGSEDSQAI